MTQSKTPNPSFFSVRSCDDGYWLFFLYGLIIWEINPILECLADQARHDMDWPDKNCSGSSLLKIIIEALECHGMLSMV